MELLIVSASNKFHAAGDPLVFHDRYQCAQAMNSQRKDAHPSCNVLAQIKNAVMLYIELLKRDNIFSANNSTRVMHKARFILCCSMKM